MKIAIGIFIYIFVGGVVAGFFDFDPADEQDVWGIMAYFIIWPIVLVGFGGTGLGIIVHGIICRALERMGNKDA